jgi:hypothetical protein
LASTLDHLPGVLMRRPIRSFFPSLFAAAVLSAASLVAVVPVSAGVAATTTTCANGVDDTPGLGLICEVTIVNTITPSGGSASVAIRECHGAAGAPTATCSNHTTHLTKPVRAVTQCNAAINGGGGTLRCSVHVTNRFVGIHPTVRAVTVNQCVGSGGGIHTGCDPFPATTTGARITQCNGSANGGTLVGLICTATGTRSSVDAVTINQCNGSANGGGALVICSANQTNTVVTGGAGGAGGTGGTGGPTPTAPATHTVDAINAPATGLNPLALAVTTFLVSLALIVGFGNRSVRVRR